MTAELRTTEPAATGLYGAALRDSADGRDGVLHVVGATGDLVRRIDTADWASDRPGDAALLARCGPATLDVGCGPGRLSAALARSGLVVLGVDISTEAVRQARLRGAPALRRDVFRPLPEEGKWGTVLLADGNVGIGGDPATLLRRCRELLRPGGVALVEVAPPGDHSWTGKVRLRYAQRQSAPFPWAVVSADDIAAVTARTGLRVREMWTEERRWFAHLDR